MYNEENVANIFSPDIIYLYNGKWNEPDCM